MKALIIEDEALSAQSLEAKLKKLRPGIDVLGSTSSINESVDFLNEHPDVDIIFSDIRIDDGLSFAIFDRVQTNAMVVFVTGFDEYAIKAFDYNCADYLLKPVSDEDLEDAIKRCEERSAHMTPQGLKAMSEDILKRKVDYRKRVLLEQGTRTLVAPIEDICFIVAELGGTKVFLKDNTYGYIGVSLTQLLNELDPARFFRVNRQYIVALDAIEAFDSTISQRECILILRRPYNKVGIKIPVAKKKELITLMY